MHHSCAHQTHVALFLEFGEEFSLPCGEKKHTFIEHEQVFIPKFCRAPICSNCGFVFLSLEHILLLIPEGDSTEGGLVYSNL